ncbi:ribonuclease H-like domain-containing protein, partial [Tanacetum coccineum]
EDPQQTLKGKSIVDSGCSRHMTGNKAYLVEYQEFKGGSVAFGDSKGNITGKGKIKTGKLDFEDVYFVKELQHFNLFYVSQMCDKKNMILFTGTECLVLYFNFKLSDENQVLLRVPRQNNMYSFNLENIVPNGGLAYLITKAAVDESNKWHRRLCHVNFENLNKLVKENLVRGLPSKIFQNDHTCVACQKGKQHKASFAERKNRTLIEAARTMLADSFLITLCGLKKRIKLTKLQSAKEYFVLPLWSSYTLTGKSSEAKNGDDKSKEDTGSKTNEELVDDEDQVFLDEIERQEKEAEDAAESLRKKFAQLKLLVNTGSTPVNTASSLGNDSVAKPSYPDPSNYANEDDSQIPDLEDIHEVPNEGVFTSASYDDEGAVADFTNFKSTMNIEPKNISQALEEESWVDAMQEELLQFKIEKVWILVDMPFGKKAIVTK